MIKKIILASLLTTSFTAAQADEKWLHVGGLSKHYPYHDYNEMHPGVGVEFKKNWGNYKLAYSADLMLDSFKNPMALGSVGVQKELGFGAAKISFGVMAGAAYRSSRSYKTEFETEVIKTKTVATHTLPNGEELESVLVREQKIETRERKAQYANGVVPMAGFTLSIELNELVGLNILAVPEVKGYSPNLAFMQLKIAI